ncbi:hypothetical protein, partial [Methanopyrus sp.]
MAILFTLILALGFTSLPLNAPPQLGANVPDAYPWCGVYPPDIETTYVNNWDPNLNPEHIDDWKRIAREILGDPKSWWERYTAGTPL